MPLSSEKLIFASTNPHKFKEIAELCSARGVEVEHYDKKLEELQTADSKRLIDDKLLRVFRELKRPVLVEHTGLRIHAFGNMPAGLTQLFWDNLKEPGFCRYFAHHSVTAFTIVGFCDGRRLHQFCGEIDGVLQPQPRGCSQFQWDNIFQPEGCINTFGEMSLQEKNSLSMRSRAFNAFLKYVGTNA